METPGRARRPRKSIIPDESNNATDTSDTSPDNIKRKIVAQTSAHSKQANGSAISNGKAKGSSKQIKRATNPRVDDSGHFEFGGSLGVSAMMIIFPL